MIHIRPLGIPHGRVLAVKTAANQRRAATGVTADVHHRAAEQTDVVAEHFDRSASGARGIAPRLDDAGVDDRRGCGDVVTAVHDHGAAAAILIVGHERAAVLNVAAVRPQNDSSVLRCHSGGSHDAAIIDGQRIDIAASRTQLGESRFNLTDIVDAHRRWRGVGVTRQNGEPFVARLHQHHVRTRRESDLSRVGAYRA